MGRCKRPSALQRAVRAYAHRLPEDIPPELAKLANDALSTIYQVMLRPNRYSHARLTAAIALREELCRPREQVIRHGVADAHSALVFAAASRSLPVGPTLALPGGTPRSGSAAREIVEGRVVREKSPEKSQKKINGVAGTGAPNVVGEPEKVKTLAEIAEETRQWAAVTPVYRPLRPWERSEAQLEAIRKHKEMKLQETKGSLGEWKDPKKWKEQGK